MYRFILTTLALMTSVSVYAGPIVSGGGDSYLQVNCKSLDGKISLDGDVGISCAHQIEISGAIQETMSQTCTSKDVQFFYIEAARLAGRISISGSHGNHDFVLNSTGNFKFKTDGSDLNREAFDFDGEMIFLSWVNGEKIASVTPMRCSGQSLSQP